MLQSWYDFPSTVYFGFNKTMKQMSRNFDSCKNVTDFDGRESRLQN